MRNKNKSLINLSMFQKYFTQNLHNVLNRIQNISEQRFTSKIKNGMSFISTHYLNYKVPT